MFDIANAIEFMLETLCVETPSFGNFEHKGSAETIAMWNRRTQPVFGATLF